MPDKRGQKGFWASRAGFGLPEALMALIVLTVAVLGIAASAARSGALINNAQSRMNAMGIARVQLEALLAQPYGSLQDGSASRENVQLSWDVEDGTRTKKIVLEYSYTVPGEVRVDTLSAAARRP